MGLLLAERSHFLSSPTCACSQVPRTRQVFLESFVTSKGLEFSASSNNCRELFSQRDFFFTRVLVYMDAKIRGRRAVCRVRPHPAHCVLLRRSYPRCSAGASLEARCRRMR